MNKKIPRNDMDNHCVDVDPKEAKAVGYVTPSFSFCDENPAGKLGANNCCESC